MTRLATLALLSALLPALPAAAAHDWNEAGIKWQPYEAGLAKAKADKKPVCLVFYTEWCPHCANYAGVFHDPKVVEQAKQFVMIKLDRDRNQALSQKFSPDGEYIPRTYFLKSDGTLDPEIKAPRDKYKYFYDEKNPASVLAAMDTALKKLR